MNIANELNIVYIKQAEEMDVIEIPVSKFEQLLQKAYELGRKELIINQFCELGNINPLPTGDIKHTLEGNYSNQFTIDCNNTVSLIEQG